MRQLQFAALLAAWCVLASCNGGSTPPVASDLTINLAGTVFPLGMPKNKVDESFTFFAGTTVDRFSVSLTTTGLSSTMKLEARPGDGGAPLQTVTTSGPVTVNFPGNVGVLRFVSDGLDTPAGMSLTSMTLHSPGTPAFPAVTTALTGQVTSMPMTLNRPVEIAFPLPPSRKTYFMAVTGVGGKTLDIVVDGPGRVLFSTDAAAGFVLPEAGSGEPGGFTTTTGAATTITMNPARNTLLLTLDAAGIEGHTRVSVNEATAVLSVRARFMSSTAITAAQVAAVTASLTRASTILYQLTMGRVRIGSLTMLSRLNSSDGSSARPNLVILPPTPLGGLLPSTPIPAGAVVFDMSSAPGPATSGVALARSMLNARFSLPFEPPDANGAITCPNSFMSNSAGQVLPTLCWRGNHNPFASNGLGAAAPTAAWDLIAGRLSQPTVSASPAHVLRTLTAITFPITTTIVP